MSKIERRPNSVYGFGGRRGLKYFFSGLDWGIVCLSLLIAALSKLGFLVIDNRLLFGRDIFRYGAIWLAGFFLVGLLEEYLTRGYLQYTLTRGLAGVYQWAFKTRHSKALGFWTAAIIFSFLYGVADSGLMVQHHLLATHPVGRPILSGGTTGPEGSVLIIAILALASLIILFTLPRTHHSDLPHRSA